jgi:hypothetical protein
MINAEPVPGRDAFFSKIETSIAIDKPSPVSVCICAEAGIVINLLRWVNMLGNGHNIADFDPQIFHFKSQIPKFESSERDQVPCRPSCTNRSGIPL